MREKPERDRALGRAEVQGEEGALQCALPVPAPPTPLEAGSVGEIQCANDRPASTGADPAGTVTTNGTVRTCPPPLN